MGRRCSRNCVESVPNAVDEVWFRVTGFVGSRLASLLIDVVIERVNNLYSHRSFHGRGKPNTSVVGPPHGQERVVWRRLWIIANRENQ
jgi:hypothetical protein